ncbi:hypothetical protein [Streptomyces sp. E5N298]|uniref:hypothetical protein n=1 Tax=Streptomyces sp. E5N298 TaxID=1851983 RepID=UPI000EF5E9C8|nr:hypothetical protein [Streptomyces sp. E5N298]
MCDRHRYLAPKLMGSTSLNYRRLQPVEGSPPRCGTLHDRQPIEQALWSHARIWLTSPCEEGGNWIQRLRAAADHAAYVRSKTAADLTEIVKVAENGPDDPAAQQRVLALLAEAEAKHVTM